MEKIREVSTAQFPMDDVIANFIDITGADHATAQSLLEVDCCFSGIIVPILRSVQAT